MGCTGTKDIVLQAERPQKAMHIEKEFAGVADEYAECTVCFEPLCSLRCATLRHNGRRVCRHLIHQQCAEAMQCAGRYNCPECRARFDSVTPLPDLTNDNTREWFEAVDQDGDGRLSRVEVLQVLKAQYRLDWRKLEQHIDGLWLHWDKDGSGDIAYHELVAPGGLVEYVTGSHVTETFRTSDEEDLSSPPLSDMNAWFSYWDTDKNGTLDQQEVQRALMKTFQLRGDLPQVQTMRETLEAVWALFDVDGSNEIDIQEFLMPNGLGETLTLSLKTLQTHHSHLNTRVRRVSSQTNIGG